jgi:hypothetical protein
MTKVVCFSESQGLNLIYHQIHEFRAPLRAVQEPRDRPFIPVTLLCTTIMDSLSPLARAFIPSSGSTTPTAGLSCKAPGTKLGFQKTPASSESLVLQPVFGSTASQAVGFLHSPTTAYGSVASARFSAAVGIKRSQVHTAAEALASTLSLPPFAVLPRAVTASDGEKYLVLAGSDQALQIVPVFARARSLHLLPPHFRSVLATAVAKAPAPGNMLILVSLAWLSKV